MPPDGIGIKLIVMTADQHWSYPLTLKMSFLVLIHMRLEVYDAQQRLRWFIQIPMLSLRQNVAVFGDKTRRNKLYNITTSNKADVQHHAITDAYGRDLGYLCRSRNDDVPAHAIYYDIHDASRQHVAVIRQIPSKNRRNMGDFSIEIAGRVVLRLQSQRLHQYTLEALSQVPSHLEVLLIHSCIVAIFLATVDTSSDTSLDTSSNTSSDTRSDTRSDSSSDNSSGDSGSGDGGSSD